MPIAVIGINHEQAEADLRSKLAFTEAQIQAALHHLNHDLGIDEAMILSTCNRTEIYARTDAVNALPAWWAQEKGVCLRALQPIMYHHSSTDAVRHAMRVASGLDSMVLGEPQILGQFKTAIHLADETNMIGPKLRFTMQCVLHAAKQIRHKTAIGYCPVSMAFSATKLLQDHLPELSNCRTLFLGAGDTIALMLKHLSQNGLTQPIIANRTLSGAERLADEYDGHADTLDSLAHLLPQVDLVISATQSPHYLVTPDMIGERDAPLTLVDLAMPHDMDPSLSTLEQVALLSIDDIQRTIEKNTLARSQAAEQAESMIDEQLEQYHIKQRALDTGQTITAMREQLLSLSEQELAKALKRLEKGEDAKTVLTAYAHALNQKWLHTPSTSLQKASASGRLDMVELAHSLFELAEQ